MNEGFACCAGRCVHAASLRHRQRHQRRAGSCTRPPACTDCRSLCCIRIQTHRFVIIDVNVRTFERLIWYSLTRRGCRLDLSSSAAECALRGTSRVRLHAAESRRDVSVRCSEPDTSSSIPPASRTDGLQDRTEHCIRAGVCHHLVHDQDCDVKLLLASIAVSSRRSRKRATL